MYHNRRNDLSFSQGWVRELQSNLLSKIHFRNLIDNCMRWLVLHANIKWLAKNYECCQKYMKMASQEPLNVWEWSVTAWQRVRVDYAEPFYRKKLFVLIDAYYKCPELIMTEWTSLQQGDQKSFVKYSPWTVQLVGDMKCHTSKWNTSSYQRPIFLTSNGLVDVQPFAWWSLK